MHRKMLAILLSVATMLSLAACGGNSNESNTNESNKVEFTSEERQIIEKAEARKNADIQELEAVQEDTDAVLGGKITVAIWADGFQEGYESIIDAWGKDTGVSVNIQAINRDDYLREIADEINGAGGPDVFLMDTESAQYYMKKGLLLDITDQLANSKDVELEYFYPEIVDAFNYDGKQYGMPRNVNTVALWYNKTIFDNMGVKYPSSKWKWNSLTKAAKKLSNDRYWGFAIRHEDDRTGFYSTIYSMGGYVFKEDMSKTGFDHPNTIQAMKTVTDMIFHGYSADYETITERTPLELFEEGRVAMIMCSSDLIGELSCNEYVRENCDLTLLPYMESKDDRTAIIDGYGWVINSNTGNPDAARNLLEYLGMGSTQKKQADLGLCIPAYRSPKCEWTVNYDDNDGQWNISAYQEMLAANTVYVPYSGEAVEWGNLIREKLEEAWTGERAIEDVCVDIEYTIRENTGE